MFLRKSQGELGGGVEWDDKSNLSEICCACPYSVRVLFRRRCFINKEHINNDGWNPIKNQ